MNAIPGGCVIPPPFFCGAIARWFMLQIPSYWYLVLASNLPPPSCSCMVMVPKIYCLVALMIWLAFVGISLHLKCVAINLGQTPCIRLNCGRTKIGIAVWAAHVEERCFNGPCLDAAELWEIETTSLVAWRSQDLLMLA